MINPEDLDLERYPCYAIVPLIDGLALKPAVVTDYMMMRTACVNDNWAQVFRVMRIYPERPLTQVYGMHCFSKMAMLTDASGALIEPARQSLRMCYDVLLRAETDSVSSTLVVFTLHALYSFISNPPGEIFEQFGLKKEITT